jgi:hypothetical protein
LHVIGQSSVHDLLHVDFRSSACDCWVVARLVRLLLLLAGFGIIAWLVYRAGPQLVTGMLMRTGWGFPIVVALYAVHVSARAAALWRTVIDGRVRYLDVLRIRFAGEAVEMLTFTGPFLAEPAKGWLLTQRGLPTATAFAAAATEYLLYTVLSSCLAAIGLSLLLARHVLPPAIRPAALVVLVVAIAFVAAVAVPAATGVGLIVPLLRASRRLIGARRAQHAANEFRRIEDVLVTFLHVHHRRLAEVLAIEAVAHGLLALEIWIVFTALGVSRSWSNPIIFEGGVKFIGIAFAFIPGQVGATEAVYEVLAGAIGVPAVVGLTLALVRRLRSLLVAGAGLIAFAGSGNPERAS